MGRHHFQIPALGKGWTRAKHMLTHALDLALPPISPVSGRVLSGHGGLAADEWSDLQFLTPPLCHACGTPLELAGDAEALCGACLVTPSDSMRTRAALVYDDVSKKLVLGFKHGGHTDCLDLMGNWMFLAGRDLWPDTDALIPVPLHAIRRMRRRFNQSALLANALSARTGLPVPANWLKRTRHTPMQGRKTARGRQRNVQGAFLVPDAAKAQVRDQRIVLVDDVRTSGATLAACAKVLLRAGAAQVNAVTLARIVKPVDATT